MGRVYLGVDPERSTRVAIKVLSKQTPELLQRFFAEARAVSLISHFNIVNLLDLSELPDGRPYMVMELVEGESLRDAAPTATLSQLGKLLGDVLAALQAAHAIGIVHRDLKPDNIMVTRAGHAKVLDFGVAKLAPGVGGGHTPRTQEGTTMGTPAYMAPEQVTGGAVDARTDVYAMGIVLFEALTGKRPFSGATDFDVMRAHRDRPPPSARTLRPSLPRAVDEVILRALAKNPARRYQSASAMAAALAAAVDGRELGDGGPPSSPSHDDRETVAGHRSAPKRSRIPTVIAMASIAIAATTVFVISRARRDARHDVANVSDAALLEAGIDAPVDAMPIDAAPDADAASGTAIDVAPAPRAIADVSPPTLPPPISRAPDFEGDAFDPLAYLPRATHLARELAPDAQLVSFFATPLVLRNVVDLERVKTSVRYVFVTAAGAAAPAIGDARPCLVTVQVSAKSVTAKVMTDKRCAMKPSTTPRCTLAQVRARVDSAYGADGTRDIDLSIEWRHDQWVVRGPLSVGGAEATMEMADC